LVQGTLRHREDRFVHIVSENLCPLAGRIVGEAGL